MSTSPWSEPPEVAPELATCEPIYTAIIRALHACSRQEGIPTLAAAITILDVANDLIVNAGLLWATPDFVTTMRTIANDLEARQKDGPARPLQPSLRQWFASAVPRHMN